MKKHYIGDDVPEDDVKAPDANKVLTMESLRAHLHEMSVLAEIEQRAGDAIVLVRDNIGTGQFLANALDDHSWLRSKSYKTERRGTATLYFLRLDK